MAHKLPKHRTMSMKSNSLLTTLRNQTIQRFPVISLARVSKHAKAKRPKQARDGYA
jgi:hypothetical protein